VTADKPDPLVIVVTGGASGLGRSLVANFSGEGHHVVFLDRSEHKVRELADDIPESVGVVGDVRSAADNERAVGAALDRFGRLDAAVGCAAITDRFVLLTEIPEASFDDAVNEVLDVNLKGYMRLARATAGPLRRSGGSMVFTLSTSALFAAGGGPLYTISKHAGVGLVRQLAWELGPEVRVNAVVPAVIADSDIRGPAALGEADQSPQSARAGLEDAYRASVPLRSFPVGDDYYPIYRLLVSRENTTATGAIVNWDAGTSVVGHGYHPPRAAAAQTDGGSSW
jgi:2,3-dihydroxy-2,3-dihydrophenylpropionate dehydrogenase